ncbi:serine/threonine protein kinase [Hokovirus HKV1]|uniref:Serine/threonine protein kinase n=1 Tax=Hokovirus HKV1 TaxID=1977638 RepID=A0A1V0SF08_9VIRU|nr:serine/threonine protein kinase [Hokovirus HKV1]
MITRDDIDELIKINPDIHMIDIIEHDVICKIGNKNKYLYHEYIILTHLHELIIKKKLNNKIVNIPKIINFFPKHKNKKSILILEKIKGVDLFNYITSHDIDNMTKLVIIYKIVLIINELHKNNISHGDIKLENFIIEFIDCDTKNNKFNDTFNKIKIWLIDFEFSTIDTKNISNKLGTFTYSSPELYFLGMYNTKENDIWCLGFLIYCVLNKSLPFDILDKKYENCNFHKIFLELNSEIKYYDVPLNIKKLLSKIFVFQNSRVKIKYIKNKFKTIIKNINKIENSYFLL